MNKAELIEAMASESGLSKADAKRALDAITTATTRGLAAGDRVGVVDFGSFSAAEGVQNAGRDGVTDAAVHFEPCPEFAAALDLVPGNGDERRNRSCRAAENADLVVDAALIASETTRRRERGLSEASATRALEGFSTATTSALNRDEAVSLDEFGTFSVSKRSARTGRNPERGGKASAKKVVEFKAGAELSKAVN